MNEVPSEIDKAVGSFTMCVMPKDLSNLEIADQMIKLLERQIELQEEQNELVRENTQLLGDVLNSLDTLGNRPPTVVNVGAGGVHNEMPSTTSVQPILTEQKGPVPPPEPAALLQAMHGPAGVQPGEEASPDYDVFWPKSHAKPGWVRVSIKHPNKDSLAERVRRGCLCGKPIVVKEHNGDSFHTCEALTKKGSCNYRPAAYFDKLTFLTNVPSK